MDCWRALAASPYRKNHVVNDGALYSLAAEDYSITPREECWIDVMEQHH
jgi:hypothetical protein